jgi:hypothetical protein
MEQAKLLKQWLQSRGLMWGSVMASLFMLGGMAAMLYVMEQFVPAAAILLAAVLGGIALYVLDAKAVDTLRVQAEATDYFSQMPKQANDAEAPSRKVA